MKTVDGCYEADLGPVKRQMEQGSSVLQAYSPLGWWLRMVLSASSSSGESGIRPRQSCFQRGFLSRTSTHSSLA